jgi:hypothetical protein
MGPPMCNCTSESRASLGRDDVRRSSHKSSTDMTPRSRGASRPKSCVSFVPPSKQRGRREDRVRAAPAVSCAKCANKSAHEHTGSAETLRPSLRSGFTAYSVLSPVNGSFATVISGTPHSIHLDRCATANLTPAPRRQDHTTSPYASRANVLRALRVHRIPPHVRDDREPPLDWVRRAELCR